MTSAPKHNRREFLRAGLAAFGSLSLSDLLRLRAAANQADSHEPTAVIVVWLRGGASHLETFDPKPDAPSDYRGPYGTLQTRTPGLRVGELLPRHARISDRFTILRSMAHTGGGHPAGSLQVLSGDTDAQDKLRPHYPDFMSVAHRLRSGSRRILPNYIGVNPIVRYDSFTIAGPGYLGETYAPFAVTGDPNSPTFPRAEHRPGGSRSARSVDRTARLAAELRHPPPGSRPLRRHGRHGFLPIASAQSADQFQGGGGIRPESRTPSDA